MAYVLENSSGKLRLFVLGFIRVLLVVAMFSSFLSGRSLVLTFASIGLVVTFIPSFLRIFFGIKIPASFEVIVLLFIYGLLVFGSVKGSSFDLWWWNVLINLGSAIILGFVGLTILMVLNNEEIVDASSHVIAIFAFCFAFSLGSLWEIFEFAIDSWTGFGLQGGLNDTMRDLVANAIGSALVSIGGYRYMRSGKKGLFSFLVFNFMKSNLSIFRSSKYLEYSSNKMARLIEGGEGENMEFKSTLRKNLYTGKLDKDIEHSVLKTIVAYLNSKGGTILVGVDDSGKVLGLGNDEFVTNDKLKLYLTGVLRKRLGSQALHHIQYGVYPFKDKHILKIECAQSNKRVFLKKDGVEEFYVRYGPSSVRLMGSDLVDYINERFG